ncbi:MAG: helix-turn-helix transcriptional regulator [Pseudomonadota bacterium]
MDIVRQVGINLRHARLSRDLSQETLAIEAHVAMNYVSGIERGVRNPTARVLDRLAKVLGIPVAELFAPILGRTSLAKSLKPGPRPNRARNRPREQKKPVRI